MTRLAFEVACVLAAGWALFLIGVHHDAVLETLQPGALCGPEGGCGAVLASEWSTIFGVAVSAPAVPLYLTLACVSRFGLDPRKVAGLGVVAGLAGLGFGGWLLVHMLSSVGAVCRYCLVMDGLNLLVLVLALARSPRWPGLDLVGGLAGSVLVGTFALHVAWPEPVVDHAVAVAEALEAVEAAAPARDLTAGEAATTGETKRVVLNDAGIDIPIGADVPTKGPADAPVTVVLFEDFQCPYCRQLAGNVQGLLEERGDEVRVAWYHFPMHTACNPSGLKKDMHPRACAAAKAGVCAHAQGRFWPMHDTLFLNSAKLSDTEIAGYAADVGLDVGAFEACMADPATQTKVEQDALAAAGWGVKGTPTFFVNGRRLSGAQPVEALVAVVDALKAEARTERILLDVELRGEVTGVVQGPATVSAEGPFGAFTIDAFEASLQGDVAVSAAGAVPASGVTWFEASAACEAAGKRLCTEGEWLSACTGTVAADANGDGAYSDEVTGNRYPYGTWRQEGWCVTKRDPEAPGDLVTGTHPRCVSEAGAYDLEGLMKEWVGVTPDTAGVKGGSYYSGTSARCGYYKDQVSPYEADASTGFRCCSGPLPEAAETFPGGRVGDKVLDWRLPGLDGGELASADFAGRPLILTFWASWCGPCRKELPALEALWERYRDQGLQVVAVNVDRDVTKARAFLEGTPVPFPVALDSDSALVDRFDEDSVPATYWIGADGVIRLKTVGYDEGREAAFEEQVRSLIEELR